MKERKMEIKCRKKNNGNHNNLKFQGKFDEITWLLCQKLSSIVLWTYQIEKINVLCENALDAPMNIVKKMWIDNQCNNLRQHTQINEWNA